jgi:hypothetical protein
MSAQCSIADGQLHPTCRNLEWNDGSREPRGSQGIRLRHLQQMFATTENKQTVYERLIQRQCGRPNEKHIYFRRWWAKFEILCKLARQWTNLFGCQCSGSAIDAVAHLQRRQPRCTDGTAASYPTLRYSIPLSLNSGPGYNTNNIIKRLVETADPIQLEHHPSLREPRCPLYTLPVVQMTWLRSPPSRCLKRLQL